MVFHLNITHTYKKNLHPAFANGMQICILNNCALKLAVILSVIYATELESSFLRVNLAVSLHGNYEYTLAESRQSGFAFNSGAANELAIEAVNCGFSLVAFTTKAPSATVICAASAAPFFDS